MVKLTAAFLIGLVLGLACQWPEKIDLQRKYERLGAEYAEHMLTRHGD